MDVKKEWTLMFFFAGDNELAPLVVPELKGIKDAGFHGNIDVLVHFDTNALKVPTRVYNVNRDRKGVRMRAPNKDPFVIGDGNDPFVRNMQEDEIDLDNPDDIKGGNRRPSSKALLNALRDGNEVPADVALANFIGFCRESHPAKRYMLFLLGHGIVVGNDAFLPDNTPKSAVTLKRLGEILKKFTEEIGEDSTFELLGLHSCSMSSIEVAYELKGTAKYMMASEGPQYVGSFPYRQMMKKTFNHLKKAKEAARNAPLDIQDLVEKLYFLTLHNGTDFMLAGYSTDLALCNLDSTIVSGVKKPIQNLVKILKKGLKDSSKPNRSADAKLGRRIKELVLLAHWQSQSYWGETYTDLFDFCHCLREMCDTRQLKPLKDACGDVIRTLDMKKSRMRSERFNRLIIRSENFGTEVQYSHGLSVYFPWSRPVETVRDPNAKPEDEVKGTLERYAEYDFTSDLGKNSSWLSFLQTYFDETQRPSRPEEDNQVSKDGEDEDAVELGQTARADAEESFNRGGVLSGFDKIAPSVGPPPDKIAPPIGVGCSCPSIKNYRQVSEKKTKRIHGKEKRNCSSFFDNRWGFKGIQARSR